MTRTNRMLLVLLASAAAVAAFWMLALAPKRERAAALSEQIAAKQVELDGTRQLIATYEQAKAAYPQNYATVARLGKAVPADDDVRSLLIQLDAAARRSKVRFELIDVGKNAAPTAPGQAAPAGTDIIPGTTGNPAGFSSMPMSFAFEGSYFGLSDFLARLERFVSVSNERIDVTGRLLILQSISVAPDEEGFPNMRAQISATSYLVPAAQGLTDGATPQGPAPATPAPAGAAPAVTTAATSTGVIR